MNSFGLEHPPQQNKTPEAKSVSSIGEKKEGQKSWFSAGREHVIHTVHLTAPNRPDCATTIAFLIDPALIPLLPSPLPPAAIPYEGEPNFSIRQSPKIDEVSLKNEDIGLGLYASRFIPAGTLIVRHHPALVAPVGNFPYEAYEALGEALPKEYRAEVLSMANCYRVKNPRDKENVMSEVEGIIRTNGLILDMKTPSLDQKKRNSNVDSELPKESYGGIHPVINRGNHSCGPNAAIKWDQDTLTESLYALRDIEKDEEILHSYADCSHSREKRMCKLSQNYKFSCDCPWCDVQVDGDVKTREDKIKASDMLREALASWIFMHPTYKKWSDDLCAADDLVIKNHEEVLSLLGVEGMYGLQLFFVEEIALCYAILGNEVEFKKWGKLVLQLSQVEDKILYRKFSNWLEDPPRRVNRWGWRVKQRQQRSRKRLIECDHEEGQDALRFLFQLEDCSESDSDY